MILLTLHDKFISQSPFLILFCSEGVTEKNKVKYEGLKTKTFKEEEPN